MKAKMFIMEAGKLSQMFGRQLLGTRVLTRPCGEVPGGWATIRQLSPDKQGAPEIVFQIDHDSYGSVGVFATEILDVPFKPGRGRGQFKLLRAVPAKRKKP